MCVQVKARDRLPPKPRGWSGAVSAPSQATDHTSSKANRSLGTWPARGHRFPGMEKPQAHEPALPPALGRMLRGQKDLLGGHNQAKAGGGEEKPGQGTRAAACPCAGLRKVPDTGWGQQLHTPCTCLPLLSCCWSLELQGWLCRELCPALPMPPPSRQAGAQGSRGRAPSLPGGPTVRSLSRSTWAGCCLPSRPLLGQETRSHLLLASELEDPKLVCAESKLLEAGFGFLPICPRLYTEQPPPPPPQASRSCSPAWASRTNPQDPGSPGQAAALLQAGWTLGQGWGSGQPPAGCGGGVERSREHRNRNVP